ncbi:MAG: HAD-IB family phosphatase [Blastochloris sp.]|nr:HAD-IB family phosphatase [Blastochloris sp.]
MSSSVRRLIAFDCDSTLSAIEGIDELARMRGPEVLRACERMTLEAMEGRIPLESIFSERLNIIRPSRGEMEEIGRRYIETVEPCAEEVVVELKGRGWDLAILSGGFQQAIEPLAAKLGISRVTAVPLLFDEAGVFAGYDIQAPTARSGGKPEVLARWRKELGLETLVMVGDGSSDLETQGTVDLFVGFGRYVCRDKVRDEAECFVCSLGAVPKLLKRFEVQE